MTLKQSVNYHSNQIKLLSKLQLDVQIAPKEDEVKELQAYAGPSSELAPPEQFLLAMATVPRLTDKLNILILMQQFEVLSCSSPPAMQRRCPEDKEKVIVKMLPH